MKSLLYAASLTFLAACLAGCKPEEPQEPQEPQEIQNMTWLPQNGAEHGGCLLQMSLPNLSIIVQWNRQNRMACWA